jgi:O-antigen/teichoic acid export membrane protein
LSDTDVARRVTRGGAARAASFALGSLLTAIGSIFLLRHLGLVDFGRYGTVIALLTIVGGFTEGGLTTTATRDMALLHGVEDRHTLLRDLLALRVTLSLLGVAVAVGFAVVAGYDATMVLGTFLAGIGIVLVSAQAAFLVPLTVDLQNTRVAVSDVMRQGLLVAGMIAFALAGAGLGAFFANQLLAGAVLLLISPLIVGRANVAWPRWNWQRSRALLREAAPLAIVTVLGTVYFRVLVLVTSLLADERQTALFVTSSRVFELLFGLPILLTGVVLPVMTVAARDDPGRLRYVNQRLTELAVLAGMLLFVVLIIGSRPILVLLGGDQYGAVAPVLRLQAPMIITLFLVSAWNPALIALHRQRSLAVVAGAGLAASVTCGLVLIPLFDARGAAVAAVLAELVTASGAYLALRRAGPGRELQYGWVPRTLLVVGAAFAAGFAVPGSEWVQTVVAGAVFVGLAGALRLVPHELLHAIGRHPSDVATDPPGR